MGKASRRKNNRREYARAARVALDRTDLPLVEIHFSGHGVQAVSRDRAKQIAATRKPRMGPRPSNPTMWARIKYALLPR